MGAGERKTKSSPLFREGYMKNFQLRVNSVNQARDECRSLRGWLRTENFHNLLTQTEL